MTTVELLEFQPGVYTWAVGHDPDVCKSSCPYFSADEWDCPTDLHLEQVITLRVAIGLSEPEDAPNLIERHLDRLDTMASTANGILDRLATGELQRPTDSAGLETTLEATATLCQALSNMAIELAEVRPAGSDSVIVDALLPVPPLQREIALTYELLRTADAAELAAMETAATQEYGHEAVTAGYRPLNW